MLDGPMRANCEKHMVSEWAHARVCTCGLSDYCWPTQAHRQHQCICVMGQPENLLGSHLDNLCGPIRHSCAAVHIVLMGQCMLIAKSIWCLNRPMRWLAPATLHAAVGQLEHISNISAFA